MGLRGDRRADRGVEGGLTRGEVLGGGAVGDDEVGPADAAERPAAANLDALADLLRETRVKRVVVADCGLPEASLRSVLEVFADEGVELVI